MINKYRNTIMKVSVVLFVLGLLTACASADLAIGEEPPSVDWTNLQAVLTWVVGFGAPYLVGKLFAYLAENWEKWHTFPYPVKFLSPMVLSVMLNFLFNSRGEQLPRAIAARIGEHS